VPLSTFLPGVPNNSYCILSDSHLHLNAFFGGYYGAYEGNPSKPLTWMRKIGLLWGHHSFLFEAREGASWQYGSGYMSRVEVDGEEVALSQPGEKAVFADGAVTIAWEAARQSSGDDEIDVYSVEIVGVVKVVMELRPEVASLRTATDGTVHFDLQFLKSHLSANAHGVLGQTYRPDHRNRL
jgi:Root cap